MSWHADATDQYPVPNQASSPTYSYLYDDRRRDGPAYVLVVLLAFVLGTVSTLGAIYTLSNTIDRLMSVPYCQEVK
jgi:hypothetical protein